MMTKCSVLWSIGSQNKGKKDISGKTWESRQSVVVTNLLWLQKLLTLENAGCSVMSTICTVFVTFL